MTERMDQGLAADARQNNITKEEALARAGAKLPLGRVATAEEIANAVLFLASPLAAGITGVSLAVDAGLTAGNLRFVRDILGG